MLRPDPISSGANLSNDAGNVIGRNMARRSYRRSATQYDRSAQWWPKVATWPTVHRSPIPAYTSVLAPQVSAESGLCSPDDIAAILRVGSVPAFRMILTGLAHPEFAEPCLWGTYPQRPEIDLVPPVAPTALVAPVRPNMDDFIGPAEQDQKSRNLVREFFGDAGPSVEERPRYETGIRGVGCLRRS